MHLQDSVRLSADGLAKLLGDLPRPGSATHEHCMHHESTALSHLSCRHGVNAGQCPHMEAGSR